VTILGAGRADLAAGWELKSAGHKVTIPEAQTHTGGCVHTVREGFSDKLYAEAGAGHIPNTHTATLKYCGLELEPSSLAELSGIALLKGRRVRMPVGKPVDMTRVPLDLTARNKDTAIVPAPSNLRLRHLHLFLRPPPFRNQVLLRPLFGRKLTPTFRS